MIAWLPLVATAGILQAPATDVRSDAASIAKALGYWVSLCDDLAKGMTKVVLQHDEPVFEDLPGAGAQASSRADSRVPPLNTRKVSVVLFAVNPRDRILRNKLPWSTLPIGDGIRRRSNSES